MPEVIEIGVPIEEIAARQERVAKAKRFEEPDRVPVWPAINYRFLLPMVGGRFRDYYTDPETRQLVYRTGDLLFHKGDLMFKKGDSVVRKFVVIR